MRVICIRDVYFSWDTSQKSLHKGSIYHVVDILNYTQVEIHHDIYTNSIIIPAPGNWYILLETGGIAHHESHFVELPDDVLETEIEEYETENNN